MGEELTFPENLNKIDKQFSDTTMKIQEVY